MKRLVLALTLAGMLGSTAAPAMAQTFSYPAGYGYTGYGAAPGYGYTGYQDHPVLRNLLIAGGSFGLGFAAGRLTTPQYPAYGYGYAPAYGHAGHWGGHHW
ncbi:MAG TPA: hypothetical protein VG713_20405 [Pirellulales bacterium]|nr:hypothetical protein [Pirellulales bacterium]